MSLAADSISGAFCLQKRLALNLYYYASLPYRTCRNRELARSGRAPVMVLFYHRIADTHPNPWTASNRTFVRQMAWLKRNFALVSLAEAQRRLASGRNDQPCVSITFDDGYADNCQQALPLLVREQIPCTYFVTSRNVIDQQPFEHDVARGLPLPPNTPAQIMALADAGIEIGCHTRHHANLGQLSDPAQLHDEIVTAREELQDLIGRPVRYFAFPYGHHVHLSSQAMTLARQCGYAGVCSAFGGFNFPGDDPFHLQRIHADDDLIRLKNWLTMDPRKIQETNQFAAATRELLESMPTGDTSEAERCQCAQADQPPMPGLPGSIDPDLFQLGPST